MLVDYLDAAMERASYEKIEGEQPYYGEIEGFRGLWAAGSTLEECRRNLRRALEDWIFFSVARGIDVPPAGDLVRTHTSPDDTSTAADPDRQQR